MLGAVVGPLLAALLVWLGIEFRSVILWSLLPGVVAAAAMFFLAQDRVIATTAGAVHESPAPPRQRFPKVFWYFLVGVFLFGLGDFSRTFLIWLAVHALGETTRTSGIISLAVLLYALHNLCSALAAYPVGYWGDHTAKLRVLLVGYGLGVATNVMLALASGSVGWLIAAIVLSGVYIAVEETIEKAVAADLLPRELRSLGFGILACVNAVGDMASSLYVGFLLDAGQGHVAFGIAAALGMTGVVWLLLVLRRSPPGLGQRA
jgi:MFS family permease